MADPPPPPSPTLSEQALATLVLAAAGAVGSALGGWIGDRLFPKKKEDEEKSRPAAEGKP